MKIFKKISIHLFVFSLLVAPVFIYAQSGGTTVPPSCGTTIPPTPISIDIPNPLNCGSASAEDCGTLTNLITLILNNVVMPIAAVAVVMWIIYAGFTYLTAQGKPEAIAKAHQRLMWSLIGGGILLGAAAISKVVQNTINGLVNTN